MPLVAASARYQLVNADIVVKSPGVFRHQRGCPTARTRYHCHQRHGVVAAEHAGRTIGVTGSKGKSTTSALVHHLLAAGLGWDVGLAGNIGTPLLNAPAADWYVAELSSYQCHDLDTSPHVAVVTRLFPEHLDWHGSEEQYYQDKLNLLCHQPEAVVLGDDQRLREYAEKLTLAAPIFHTEEHVHGDDDGFFYQDEQLFPRSTLPLLGAHNVANLCTALTALRALGIDLLAHRHVLAEATVHFGALPHRLQPISDPAGQLTFINDSLSTTPQSAIAALEAFAGRSITVILGGTDRGLDYTPLATHLAHASASVRVITVPDSGPRISEALRTVPGLVITDADDLTSAVAVARTVTPAGGVVLLSPAAPSYGRFTDHAHRAEVFRQAIATKNEEGEPP